MQLSESIDNLELNNKITNELKEKKILKVEQLCNKRKSQLLKLGLTMKSIEQIEIKLQLQGFDLRG